MTSVGGGSGDNSNNNNKNEEKLKEEKKKTDLERQKNGKKNKQDDIFVCNINFFFFKMSSAFYRSPSTQTGVHPRGADEDTDPISEGD